MKPKGFDIHIILYITVKITPDADCCLYIRITFCHTFVYDMIHHYVKAQIGTSENLPYDSQHRLTYPQFAS